jgi:hypothetical protein
MMNKLGIFLKKSVWTLEAEAGLLNKSCCLAPTLGVTILVTDLILVTLCCAANVGL